MNKMKIKSAICSIIFLLLLSLNLKAQSSNGCTLQIRKHIKETIRGKTFWLINCTLSNTSRSPLSYFSMSCSWTDFYSVDQKEIEIEGFACDKNVPVIWVLKPGESREETLRLYLPNENKKTGLKTFKIGMNIIKSTTTTDFDKKIKTKNIIWSNEMSLW